MALWAAVIIFCAAAVNLHLRGYTSSPMRNPKTAVDFYDLSKKLDREDKFEEAKKAAAKAVELDEKFGKAYLMLAALELEMGDYRPAFGHLNRALALVEGRDPKNEHITYYNLGVVHENLKDIDRAWENFRKSYSMAKYRAKDLWPDNPRKNVYYVMRNDRAAYAERILNKKDFLPRGIHWRVNRFKEYKDKKEYQRIVDECQRYMDENPDTPYLYKFIEYKAYGLSYLEEHDEALRLLGMLAQTELSDEDQGWVKGMYGYIYRERKEYRLALKYYDEIFREHYDSVDQEKTLYDKSLVYRDMGDAESESAVLQAILDEKSETWYARTARFRLADIYLYQGKYKKSFHYYFEKHIGTYMLSIVAGTFLWAGLCLLLFFILYRVFFGRKREEIRNSRYRLRHLFFLMIIGFGLQPLLWAGTMAYNAYVFDIFSRLKVNPNLFSMLATSVVLIFASCRLLKIYGIPKETWQFSLKDVKLNIGLPVALTLSLFAFSVLYECILRLLGVVDSPPTYVEELVRNVFVQDSPVQTFLLLMIINIAGPVSEEIVFRVFTIEFVKKYTNIVVAVLISCIIFTIGHMPLEALPFYFVFALTMALTYIKTKRIFPCIMTHCLFNSGVLVVYFMFG